MPVFLLVNLKKKISILAAKETFSNTNKYIHLLYIRINRRSTPYRSPPWRGTNFPIYYFWAM
jgi:hypothetical protein